MIMIRTLGISFAALNTALAAPLSINQTHGDVIGQVLPDSPAAQANLQQGDVITAIDGRQIKTDSDLPQIINQHKPGDKVTLSIVQGNQKMNIQVTLGTAQSS